MSVISRLSEASKNSVDGEFLQELENLIDTGSIHPVNTSRSVQSLMATISSWVKSHFNSLSLLERVDETATFIQTKAFKLKFLTPEEQIGIISRLQSVVQRELSVVESKISAIEQKQQLFANSWKITKWIHSVPSQTELLRHQKAKEDLVGAENTLKKIEETALGTLKQMKMEAHQREIEETPVPIRHLKLEEIDRLLQGNGHFIFREIDPKMSLYRSKVSTIPFIAMVRQLEISGGVGPQLALPIREKLEKIGVTPEELQGVLDQEEIKKFNETCLEYLATKFGRQLVQSFRDSADLRPYLQMGIFGEYSVITGIAFQRLVRQMESEKIALKEKEERERAALRVKEEEEKLALRPPIEEINLSAKNEEETAAVEAERGVVETTHRFPSMMEFTPSQSMTHLGNFVTRQLAHAHSAFQGGMVAVEKAEEESVKKTWLPSNPMVKMRGLASKVRMPSIRNSAYLS